MEQITNAKFRNAKFLDPDHTKAKMLGIEAREMFLRSMQKDH